MTPILFFLMVGVAHWAAHLTQCSNCKETAWGVWMFLLQGVISIFGWPMDAIFYLIEAFKKPEVVSKTEFFQVNRNDGESDSDFSTRVGTIIAAKKAEFEAKGKNGK